MTWRLSTVVVRVQPHRNNGGSKAPASSRATSLRRFDSQGAALSPAPAGEWSARLAAHSPVAVKPRHPASTAKTASGSSPEKGYRVPCGVRRSGPRAS